MKNAFIDKNGVLTSWGYVESNNTGDTVIPVSDEFGLEPGKWKYVDGKWIEYVAPISLQPQAQLALSKSDITLLRCIESNVSVPTAWTDYRKALRAICNGNDKTSVVLPTQPPYPAGT